jgi:2-polyprenyl-3-methyl-5-hydroxy-6-metoxy-1,4-benzoquinol methylase
VSVGRIHHERDVHVAGVPLDLEEAVFRLLRCTHCGFRFKDPPIPEAKLLACYAQASEDQWDRDPDPIERRFDVIRSVVTRHIPRGRILDIGCSNGAMLAYFGDVWERFGIEPGRRAAALAESRGIRVLGATIESAPRELFDVIISVDVVEHIADPVPFFREVASRLRPGGICVTVTGDTDALSWRLEGSHYWYCTITEHVSFYGRRSMAEIAARCGLEPVEQHKTSHARYPLSIHVRHFAKNAAFIAGNRARGFGVPPLRRLFTEHHAPWWMAARDHLIHVMRRPPRTPAS